MGFALAVLTVWALPSPAQEGIEYVGGRAVAARQVLVKFRGLGPQTLTQVRATYDLDRAHGIGGAGVYLLRSRSRSAATLLQGLSKRRDLLYVEPDYILRTAGLPNDPRFGEQWGLQNVGQPILGSAGKPGADTGATFAWDVTTGSAGALVAVPDTGVDYNHADLAANVWSAPLPFTVRLGNRTVACPAGSHGYDSIRNTCDPLDDNSHGTQVAGIIGAVGHNGEGVTGMNWSAGILALKFLNAKGTGTTSNAIDAIEFAVQLKRTGVAYVRVIAESWGGTMNSKALMEEVGRALESDILFVAAAGNLGSNNDIVPFYPASYALPNVLSVTATDHHDELMSSANIGANTVHLGAPGAFILSTVPGGNYDYASGTSMAAAHAAGAATLMLSACPLLSTPDIRTILMDTVESTSALSGTTASGGRLNVDRAIQSCNVPAFAIFPSPASSSIAPGGTGNYSLELFPYGGFFDSVNLEVQGLPAGATATFDQQGVIPQEEPATFVNLQISTPAGINAGTYLLIVKGTSSSVARSAPIWLVVTRGKASERTN